MGQPLEFKGKEPTLKKHGEAIHLHVTQDKFVDNSTMASWREAASLRVDRSPQRNRRNSDPSQGHYSGSPPRPSRSLHSSVDKASVIVGYADASWANAAQCASQQGALVLITSPQRTEVNAKANLIDWRSNRSARVCRSTLACEAMSCDDCVDRSYFANLMLSELLTGEKPKKDLSSWRLHQLQVTDCKSLHDAISAEHPRTTEKRAYVDLRSIQQFISASTSNGLIA